MRVLVVDDELLTRTALLRLLAERPGVTEVAEAQDAHGALAKLRDQSYDVLMVDIQMPGLTGLQLVDRLAKQPGPKPSLIFVTAHSQHAVEAFDRGAVDYVLKPFDSERVRAALDIAERRSVGDRAARMLELMRDISFSPKSRAATRVAIKDKGRIVFIETSELVSAEAHGNYVVLHQRTGSYIIRDTLSGIAEKLAMHGFLRIHRSVLINIAFVEAIMPGIGSEYVLRTTVGKEYTVARPYRDSLKGLAGFWIGTSGPGAK